MDIQLKAIILAGGIGSRLWPLSTAENPKQFLKLFSGLSLFQITLIRNKFLGKPIVMVNKMDIVTAINQLREVNIDADIIIEPERKNTGPSAILAALYAQNKGHEAIALIPCDHYINDFESYSTIISKAATEVENNPFITLGIKPNGFNSNYGYIKTAITGGNIKVEKFIEKPSSDNEEIFEQNATYYWNSGIYVLNPKYLLDQARILCPITLFHIRQSLSDARILDNLCYISKLNYKMFQQKSFDILFSEKIDEISMIPCDFYWSDLGCWSELISFIREDRYRQILPIFHKKTTEDDTDSNPSIIKFNDILAIGHGEKVIIVKAGEADKIMTFSKKELHDRRLIANADLEKVG